MNEGAQPTPAQAQALRVLGYTFSILTKELRQEGQSNIHHSPAQTTPDRQTMPDIPHVNDLLQQMGLPPLRNAEAVVNQGQGRAPNLLAGVPIRPLLAPLILLILRTSLLLYFVAPTRKTDIRNIDYCLDALRNMATYSQQSPSTITRE